MELTIVWYLRMSIIYFVAGAIIGMSLLLWPGEASIYVPVHAHLNLLGFMSMMIYGVGYHILPKFSGRHIFSPAMMKIQFWTGNAGLIGMTLSWPSFMRGDSVFAENILIISALLTLLSVVLFAVNILKTIKAV